MKMYGIEILLEEHKNILKFVNFTREECKKILNGADIDVTLFKECVSFGKDSRNDYKKRYACRT